MLLTELSDEGLMSRYQLGSEEAFAVLYDRHSARVFSFVRRRFRKPERAAEVFQEVFVKMHKSKHLYNKTLPCLPWLFSVSRSVVLDNLRADERRGQEVSKESLDEFPIEMATESKLSSLEPQLAELPNAQRVALQMRYVDESTFEEIASVLKTSDLAG